MSAKSFDRHVHFSGALPESFLASIVTAQKYPTDDQRILAEALSSNSKASLYERIRAAGGLNFAANRYAEFFEVYSIVNGACRKARQSDPTFFSNGMLAISKSLGAARVTGCELIAGIMPTCQTTEDRVTQLLSGISENEQECAISLRLTLIRDSNGLIGESQLRSCQDFVKSEFFRQNSAKIAGFDISGTEVASSAAFEQLQELRAITILAEERASKEFVNSIHLGECLTRVKDLPEDFYFAVLTACSNWRIVHGLQLWFHDFSILPSSIRRHMDSVSISFDVCPSSSLLMHGGALRFEPLVEFCKLTGSSFSICTDNPSLLSTTVHRENMLFEALLVDKLQK